ncbi:MAG: anaerobic ribonucleoside-triphosphate reductase activating protein [Parachlamydiales bacterium]|nr:anaerobic ribonucleoside-triphosphate reductase activating protein [Parachlamydiales bacterium]
MLIGGLQKFSLIDFPSKMAALVFTQGCQFRCPFCHNPTLVLKERFEKPIPEEAFFSFLKTRKNKLDGVVITGGEPTLQKDLFDFIRKIKNENFLVKLDTNGTNPKILQDLLDANLLDYIAMDIKAPLEKYEKITYVKTNVENIKKSIEIIISSKIDYEFRTTLVKNLHDPEDPIKIASSIKGAKKYILQKFLPNSTLDNAYLKKESFSDEILNDLKEKILEFAKTCQIR